MTQKIHKSKKKTLSNIRNKHNKSKKKIINLQDGGAGVLRYLKTKVGSVMGTDTIENLMNNKLEEFNKNIKVLESYNNNYKPENELKMMIYNVNYTSTFEDDMIKLIRDKILIPSEKLEQSGGMRRGLKAKPTDTFCKYL